MTFRDLAFGAKAATVLRSSAELDREFRQNERLPLAELLKMQRERAARHAKFAMENTAFYRERYRDAGFVLSDLDDPAAFDELPIVEKTDVREQPDAFRSTEASPKTSKQSTTGGSTGEPLKLLRDLRFPARALEWRLMRWWGVSPADDLALVSRHVKSERESRKHRLQWWPSRRFQLDAFRMDEPTVAAFLAEWERIRPKFLIGYVGAIAELAGMIADGGVRPHPPKAIAVTAAPLSPNQRALIQQQFGAPVYDHYRSSEVPWIAGECAERDGLHIFADVRLVEILDGQGESVPAGTVGDVVASDLTNRVFPLLRYRIGDRAAYVDGACACGVTLPMLGAVAGRVTEVLHLPTGQAVAGEGLAQIFSKTPEAVRQFQIHQRADYSIDLRVVRGSAADAERSIGEATERFRQILRASVPVRLEFVDAIPHDGGKVRYLISDVARRDG